MVTRIGVIYQDSNSRGFLEGLRQRLKCDAELIPPPTPMGKSRNLTRKQTKLAWKYFQKERVDLIVRFTDADRHRRQQVHRQELDVFPEQARSICVCGVAVNNPEDWLCLDSRHLAKVPGLPYEQLANLKDRTGLIKQALIQAKKPDEGSSEVVARIVRDAPHAVFGRWLQKDDALRTFYSDCRLAAIRLCQDGGDKEVPNELEAATHG